MHAYKQGSRILIFICLALSTVRLAFGQPDFGHSAVYSCVCALSNGCGGDIEDIHSLFIVAESKGDPLLSELSKEISKGLLLLSQSTSVQEEYYRLFVWELAHKVLELKELTSLYEFGFSQKEIAPLVAGHIASLRSGILKISEASKDPLYEIPAAPVKSVKYLDIEGVPSPKVSIFLAREKDHFFEWFRGLSFDSQQAVYHRLQVISSSGHLGDVKVANRSNHQSKARIDELRFFNKSGPRIFYMSFMKSMIILEYGLKSDGKEAQNRLLQRAGKLANEIIAEGRRSK